MAAAFPARLAALLERGAEEPATTSSVLPPPPPHRLTPAPPLLARAGTPAFDARRRLLALLGWEVRAVNPATVKLRAGAAAAARDAAGAAAARAILAAGPGAPLPPLKLARPPDPRAPVLPPGSVRACDAALECTTCGATVGLWAHVPPAACPALGGGGGASPAQPSLALATLGRRGSSYGGGDASLTRPRSSSLDHLGGGGRTIAGGSFLPTPSPSSAAGEGGEASPAPTPPAIPVFGLAALQRSTPVPGGGRPPSRPSTAGADAATPPAAQPGPPPAKRTRAGLRSQGHLSPPPPPPPAPPAPSPALLAVTAGALAASAGAAPWPPPGAGGAPSEPTPVDPLLSHRRWCPWVHGAGTGGGGPGRTGWRWVLPLLIPTPGPEEALGRKVAAAAAAAAATAGGVWGAGGSEVEEEEEEGGGDAGAAGPDPAARLRAAMLQAGL